MKMADILFQEFYVAVSTAGKNLIEGLERSYGSVAAALELQKDKTQKIQESFIELYGDGNGSNFHVSKDAATGEVSVVVGDIQFVHWAHAVDDEREFIAWFSQDFEFRFTLALFKQPRMTRKSTIRVGRNPRVMHSSANLDLPTLVGEYWPCASQFVVQQVHCVGK
jgi:hypothetical protein